LVSGVLAGLLGIGGGVIIVPALTALFGVDIKQAVPTSLAVILLTAISGTIVNLRNGSVRMAEVVLIALGAVLTAPVGAMLTQKLPSLHLRRIFAVFLIVMAVKMLLEPPKHPKPSTNEAGSHRVVEQAPKL
jgi:uncharacterized membrane protein YfcA